MTKIWKLTFYDFEIETILWVYDHEKVVRKFFLDIEIQFDLGKSYVSDDLNDTIDTWLVTDMIRKHVSWKDYNLLEYITYDMCHVLLKIDAVKHAKVTTYKDQYTHIWRVGYTYEEWLMC